MRKILLAVLVLLLACGLQAAKKESQPLGTVIFVSGKVSLFTISAKQGKTLKLGTQVFPNDRLQTGVNGRAHLILTDGTQLKINYLTDITLRDTNSREKKAKWGIGSIKLALGDLWAKVTNKQSLLEFETPSAVAAVKGTETWLQVNQAGDLCVKLKEGKLDLNSELGAASLAKRQQICIKKGVKFSQDNAQTWEASVSEFPGGEWIKEIGGSSTSEVILKVKDKDGENREIRLEYEKQ